MGSHGSRATLTRALAGWNIISRRRPLATTAALRDRVAHAFFHLRLSDSETITILEIDGFAPGKKTLAKLRRSTGLYKRVPSDKIEEVEQAMREALKNEMETGHIEDFGRGHLYTWMRSRYNLIGRDRMYRIAKEVDPDMAARRRQAAQQRRGATIVPGPNFAWSMDAYCKFEHWGIQIYAAIDVYSRYIMWIYVGISGRTALSVLSQYIQTVASGKFV